MEQQTAEQVERNAIRVLAMAAEQYLKAQDELGRAFIGPQLQAAVQALTTAIDGRWSKDVPEKTPEASPEK